jgi:sulfur-oxidizing protein SoxA
MRGVAARYPAWDVKLRRPVNLGQRINLCRQRHQQAAAAARGSQELLALEALCRAAVARPADRAARRRAAGTVSPARAAALYAQRIGQLNCPARMTACHDERTQQPAGLNGRRWPA